MLLLARVAFLAEGDIYLPQIVRGAGTGLLYVGRYNWNGTNWYRDRCHMIELTSKQNWSC